jgi:hypothetical protein
MKNDQPQTKKEPEQSPEELQKNAAKLYRAWEKGGGPALEKALEDLEEE